MKIRSITQLYEHPNDSSFTILELLTQHYYSLLFEFCCNLLEDRREGRDVPARVHAYLLLARYTGLPLSELEGVDEGTVEKGARYRLEWIQSYSTGSRTPTDIPDDQGNKYRQDLQEDTQSHGVNSGTHRNAIWYIACLAVAVVVSWSLVVLVSRGRGHSRKGEYRCHRRYYLMLLAGVALVTILLAYIAEFRVTPDLYLYNTLCKVFFYLNHVW